MPTIPLSIRDRIGFHVRTLTRFNAAVTQCRAMGVQFGSPGRYEWEYRLAHEHEVEPALTALAKIEVMATAVGVSLDALYAHVGEKPVVLPWSPEAMQWRRPTDTPTQPA
jgi:hypothetical protein